MVCCCRFIREHAPIKLKVLKRLWRQMLSGIQYLHAQRPVIVHRDIKAENVLYDVYEGVVRIGDLGLAKQLFKAATPRAGPSIDVVD